MPFTIPSITPLSDPPSRADPTNFAVRGDEFLGSLPTMVDEVNATAQAIEDVGNATLVSEANAAASAQAAAFNAGATVWVSGTSYAQYVAVIDPVDFKTYRAKVATSGTTRPGLDAVNWAVIFGTGDVVLNGAQFGFRNKVINGNFNIVQRHTSLSGSGYVQMFSSWANPASTYITFDRWKSSASGASITLVGGAYTNTHTGAYTKDNTINITAGSMQQVIESINLPAGTYYVTWTGTATGRVGAGSYAASGFSFVADGVSNYTIEFQNGTLTNVQVEAGGITPFEHRPVDYEMMLCRRYFWRGEPIAVGALLFDKYGTATDQLEGLVIENVVTNGFRTTPTVVSTTGSISSLTVTNVTGFSLGYRRGAIRPIGTITATGRGYGVVGGSGGPFAIRLEADF